MVEVFKTNVRESAEANDLVRLLIQHFPGSRVNFDLEDCDSVLRIEGGNIAAAKVMMLVNANGFACNVLE